MSALGQPVGGQAPRALVAITMRLEMLIGKLNNRNSALAEACHRIEQTPPVPATPTQAERAVDNTPHLSRFEHALNRLEAGVQEYDALVSRLEQYL